MNAFERRLQRRLKSESDEITQATEGLQVSVQWRGKPLGRLEFGKTYPYYDLASLTKVIFTTSAIASLLSPFSKSVWQGMLHQPIVEVLPWWPHSQTTPFHLFTHTAGLEWWFPVYEKLQGQIRPELRWQQLEKELSRVKRGRGAKAVYSDVDLWVLGAWVQAISEMNLEELWAWHANNWNLNTSKIFFHPRNKVRYAKKLYAPTEACKWRKRTLQGEVHDENAWSLGGVAPHAGLFGTLDEVTKWGVQLRNLWLKDTSYGSQQVLRYFASRRVPKSVGDWGLGFMKPSQGRASCGKYFSLKSFGHTGFTGTSFWYDPKADLSVVLLSNRVHPTRDNSKFVQLRPKIHNWIVENL